jgi:hypothetical protein
MPLALVFIALVLIAVAWNNTQSSFAAQLGGDLSGFGKWFAALVIIGGLQWVPGLQTMARWLLGLVLLVLFLRNATNILHGFTDLASGSASAAAGPPSPAQAYVANPSNPRITTAEVTGTASGNVSNIQVAQVTNPFAQFSPQTLMQQAGFSNSEIGFGGVA